MSRTRRRRRPARRVASAALERTKVFQGRKLTQGYIEAVHKWFADKGLSELDGNTFVLMMGEIAAHDRNCREEATARALFHAFDADGNGTISFREVVAGLSTLLDGDSDARLFQAFRAFDADNNNVLDKREMTHLIMTVSKFPASVAATMVEHIFAMADFDRSGALDFDEFAALNLGLHAAEPLLRRPPRHARPRRRRRRRGSGTVTQRSRRRRARRQAAAGGGGNRYDRNGGGAAAAAVGTGWRGAAPGYPGQGGKQPRRGAGGGGSGGSGGGG